MNEVIQEIMNYLPTVLAVISMIVTAWKSLKDNNITMSSLAQKLEERIKQTSEELKSDNEMVEIKDQLTVVLEENRKLRQQISKLIETYSRVKSNDDDTKV